VRGQAQTKQEAAKVLERHGSRKRPSSARAKSPAAKRDASSTVAAAVHPLITSVFVPAAQLEAAVARAAPNSGGARATPAAAAAKPSIKSFFSHVDASAGKGAASSAAAPAARQTRAAARGIKKFFAAAVGNRGAADGSEADVIIID